MMTKHKQTKAVKSLIFTGLIYIIAGLCTILFLSRLSEKVGIESGYVFVAGMVLILLGIKDIAITPMFMDIEKKKTKKKDK